MRLLIVAMSDSVHLERWLSQISDQGWEIHLFPAIDLGWAGPDLKNVTVHHSIYGWRSSQAPKSQKLRGIPVISDKLSDIIRRYLDRKMPSYRARQLKLLIKLLKPDIIHSMEIQQAGYLVQNVRENWQGKFPKWIVTNWGSDIYLFGRFKEHKSKIRAVLSDCDFYFSECQRDVCLAKQLNFKGQILPVFPVSGGFDLTCMRRHRQPGPTSKRRLIMLKGYQGWAGRALVGLRALERAKKYLKGYKVVIYLVTSDSGVDLAAKIFSQSTGIPVEIVIAGSLPYAKIIQKHGMARISIGLSISDAISTSMLEAMIMGSFPIQSNTGCANEWLKDGQTGILVPPEDPEIIEKAIIKALTNDKLVDQAAQANWQVTKERLDEKIIKKKMIDFYRQVNNSSENVRNGR